MSAFFARAVVLSFLSFFVFFFPLSWELDVGSGCGARTVRLKAARQRQRAESDKTFFRLPSVSFEFAPVAGEQRVTVAWEEEARRAPGRWNAGSKRRPVGRGTASLSEG